MRVIAGSARGRKLFAVPGDTTRPITDRAKEALFSILGDFVLDARVLDLFAGTGAVGIEALSRGAAWCDFIDLAPAAVRTMRENVEITRLDGRSKILRRDAFRVLASPPKAPYDLIYVAPPQYHGWWHDALHAIDTSKDLLAQEGLVVVQIAPREERETSLERLVEVDRRKYGGVRLIFYALKTPEPVGEEGSE